MLRAFAACFLLAVLAGSTGDALAHASLIRSSPADGGMLAKAPERFELTFNEPVSPLVARLVTPEGRTLALGGFVLRGETLGIAAPQGLGDGTHALSWRVVSTDGHPIGGTVVFSIGAPSTGGLGAGALPEGAVAVDWPLRAAFWMAKLALYAGLFIGVGGAFFAHWIGAADGRAMRIATATMTLGVAGAVASLGLQGADALDTGLAGLGHRIVWETGLATSYGSTATIAAAAMVLGLAALRLAGWGGKAVSVLALAGVGLALAASGHASSASPQWLMRPAVFLHAVAIAFWAGALMPLASALAHRSRRRPPPEFGKIDARQEVTARTHERSECVSTLASHGEGADVLLRRFSRVIPAAFAVLVAAGLVLAVIQMRSIEALWTTAYGRVFLAKLGLLAVLVALAAWNRFRLTRPALAGDAPSIRMLRRSILAETLLFAAIFAAAACWRFTPPPRALAEAAAEPAAIHIHTLKAMADLTVTPGRAGPVSVSMIVMTGEYGPLAAREISLTLANPAAGIEPIARPATPSGDGTWRVDGLVIPAPGRWSLRLDILVSDFEMARLDGEIDIRR